MKTCASCGGSYNDGVQCTSCKKHMDFTCAGISEGGWRKLGAERRTMWKCSSCRALSPHPIASPEPASLDIILGEIRDMKRQLHILPTLVADVKSIREELSDLKSCNEFLSAKFVENSQKLTEIEERISALEPLHTAFASVQTEIKKTEEQISTSDQRSRLNNVEIKGIPTKKNEDLFLITEKISKKICYSFTKSQINYIYRIPLHNTNEKAIVISFLNRYVKEEFMAAARALKSLTASDIGFGDSRNRVYINDHLTADLKTLLTKTKLIAKEKNYSFVWVKYGKIHVRKSDTTRVLVISMERDLNKMI